MGLTLLAGLGLLGEQGARIGGLLFEPLGPGWVGFAAAAVFLLAPRARLRQRAGTTLTLAILLLLAWWPLRAWRESSVRTERKVVASIVGPEGSGRVERVAFLDLSDAKHRIPLGRIAGRSRDLTLEVAGYIRVPETGEYQFELRSGGPTTLSIGGKDLGVTRSFARARLNEGLHRIVIRYKPRTGRAFLDLAWDRPAFIEVLPAYYSIDSVPGRLDLSVIREWERRALVSLLVSLVWWGLVSIWIVRAGANKSLLVRSLYQRLGIVRVVDEVRGHPFAKPCLLVFGSAVLFLSAVWLAWSPSDRDHDFYRETSSEFMMQTVSIVDLRDQPLRSLWFLHIQPPMLDGIRVVAALLSSARLGEEELAREVDRTLRAVWLLFYGLLCALLCLWLCQTGTRGPAVGASLLFAAHPSSVFYAGFLDSTLLSALAITWFCYELWKIDGARSSLLRLGIATLTLFFTRSMFQWPFLVVLATSLALLRVPWRRLGVLVAAVGLVMGLHVSKQYWLFGTTSTSTFAGYNGCRSIGAPLGWDISDMERPLPDFPARSVARVLAREHKANGEYNFNQLHYLRISFGLWDRYQRTLLRRPFGEILAAYRNNVGIYLKPSSRYYIESPIVDRLYWRSLYERLFSGGVWIGLVLAAIGAWTSGASAQSVPRALGLVLPVLYIALVSVVFESGENMRFRFFVEPVVYVFVVSRFQQLARRFGLPSKDRQS